MNSIKELYVGDRDGPLVSPSVKNVSLCDQLEWKNIVSTTGLVYIGEANLVSSRMPSPGFPRLWELLMGVIRNCRPDLVFLEGSLKMTLQGAMSIQHDLQMCGRSVVWGMMDVKASPPSHLKDKVWLIGGPIVATANKPRIHWIKQKDIQDCTTIPIAVARIWGMLMEKL